MYIETQDFGGGEVLHVYLILKTLDQVQVKFGHAGTKCQNFVCFGAIVDFNISAVAIMLAKLHEMINCVLSGETDDIKNQTFT